MLRGACKILIFGEAKKPGKYKASVGREVESLNMSLRFGREVLVFGLLFWFFLLVLSVWIVNSQLFKSALLQRYAHTIQDMMSLLALTISTQPTGAFVC